MNWEINFKSVGFFILLLLSSTLNAQQDDFPFLIKKNQDIVLSSMGLGLSSFGFYKSYSIEPFAEAAILSLDKNDIRPKFDQSATKYWSRPIKNASDIGLGISFVGATALTASQLKRKNEWWALTVMGAETFLWTYGFTGTLKGLRQRSRPFLYNANAPLDEKLKKDARQSFFSGHTSMSAASCVFAAEVFAALHPNSKWKPWLRTGSFVLPATVGFLRYRTGKHFPTDVFTGWAVGSLVGWIVPQMHLKKTNEVLSHFDVVPNPFGISLYVR